MTHSKLTISNKILNCFQLKYEDLSTRVVDTILIALTIFYSAGTHPQTSNPIFVVITFIFVFVVFKYRKREVDNFFYAFFIAWCLINFISYNVNKIDDVGLESFFGVTIRMIMPYFIVKSIGFRFFDKLFDFAYVLIVISLPLFALEQLFPPLFSAIAPIFSFMTVPEQIDAGGFYSFIFMHNGWAWKDFRNSGFMWEPGAFAGITIILLYYYWFRTKFILDKKVLVLIVAIITTFSTAGFLALFSAVILFISKNPVLRKSPLVMVLLAAVFIYASVDFYYTSDFMSEKIDMYIDLGTSSGTWTRGDVSYLRVTRLGIFLISLENAIHRPWGEGIIFSDYIINNYGVVRGPSAISEILRQWGWLGWIMLVVAFKRFTNIFDKNNLTSILFIISASCVLFSNPFIFKYLIYSIIFYAFIYHKKINDLREKILKDAI